MLEELKRMRSTGEEEMFITRFFRMFSIYPTALLVRLRISPNAISLFSMFGTIGGAALFVLGSYITAVIGAVVLFLAHVLDYSDGEVARCTNRTTLYGAYLEVLQGYVQYCSIFLAISIRAFQVTGDVNMLWLGLSAVVFKFLYRAVETKKGALLQNSAVNPKYSPLAREKCNSLPKRIVWEAFMSVFFTGGLVVIVLAFSVVNRLELLTLFYGVAMPAIFLVQSYFHWQALKH